MVDENTKDDVKEPKKEAKPKLKVAKPEAEKPAPAEPQVPWRKLVITTDGTNVNIEFDQTTTLEKREIGRQLSRL